MSNKILMPQLISILAAQSGKPKRQAENFLKAYFNVLSSALETHEAVKLKDFGNFKVNRVEARKSVNVSTGEEVKIPAHFKIVFSPSKKMSEKVNKEFSWLSIVELSDDVENKELETAETEVKKLASDAILASGGAVKSLKKSQDNHIKFSSQKEEEEGEKLGEELEKEFGEIEPVEPFGPVDPDDPDLNEPLQEKASNSVIRDAVTVAVYDSVVPAQEKENSETSASQANEVQIQASEKNKEFDPYAIEIPSQSENEQNKEDKEPQGLSEEQINNLVTKSDLRIVVKNIKKIRSTVDNFDELSRERSKRVLLWSLIICVLLMVGGFFLTYFILLDRIKGEDTVIAGTATIENAEDADAEIYTLNPSDETPETNEAINKVDSTEGSTADKNMAVPTTPSDIKAVDRVTDTRYLTTMAKEHYGNYNLWPYIYLENEEKLGHPDRIKPGTEIIIPNLDKYNINPSNPKDIEKAKKLGVEIYKKYVQS